ncbi:MAG: hypothetical protein HC901_02250 [Bdellovibrionaceae bacterium]|nr:hypothetical protein [Pseudobdellovibrionaceae bacterium]
MKMLISHWMWMCLAAAVPARAAAPIGETITLYSVYDAKYVEVQPANGNELAANSATAITATGQFVVEDAAAENPAQSLIQYFYVSAHQRLPIN